jgi:hypothetical protein
MIKLSSHIAGTGLSINKYSNFNHLAGWQKIDKGHFPLNNTCHYLFIFRYKLKAFHSPRNAPLPVITYGEHKFSPELFHYFNYFVFSLQILNAGNNISSRCIKTAQANDR